MKQCIAALGLALASSLALAQAESGPADGVKAPGKPPHAARMQEQLGLTDEQVQKMSEIREGGGTREEMQSVLTPEQRAKSAELKKEYRSDRSQRKARIQEELGLSDEQMKQMSQIRREGGSRADMRAILTPEQQEKFDAIHGKRKGMGQKSPHSPAGKHPPAPAPAPADTTTP